MTLTKAVIPTRRAFSDRMLEFGKIDENFAVFEADIGHSTYTYLFGDEYPNRYFNLGIAEQNMVASAAGMAADGRKVVASTFQWEFVRELKRIVDCPFRRCVSGRLLLYQQE